MSDLVGVILSAACIIFEAVAMAGLIFLVGAVAGRYLAVWFNVPV